MAMARVGAGPGMPREGRKTGGTGGRASVVPQSYLSQKGNQSVNPHPRAYSTTSFTCLRKWARPTGSRCEHTSFRGMPSAHSSVCHGRNYPTSIPPVEPGPKGTLKNLTYALQTLLTHHIPRSFTANSKCSWDSRLVVRLPLC